MNIDLKLATLPRSKFVSRVNLSRCSRFCCHGRVSLLNPPDLTPERGGFDVRASLVRTLDLGLICYLMKGRIQQCNTWAYGFHPSVFSGCL